MALIRPAVIEDVAEIAEMGERFHSEAAWADIVDYVADDCKVALAGLVASDDGILLVAEADGRIIGMAGGMASPIYFNHAHRTGQELFWWVEPGRRDGTGGRLLDALEEAARAIGCKSWAMIALDKVKPELMGRIYKRRGYRASETSYIKRL